MPTCLLHVVAYGSGRTSSNDITGLFSPDEQSFPQRDWKLQENHKDNHEQGSGKPTCRRSGEEAHLIS